MDELALLEAKLNALIDEQNTVDSSIYHIRQKNREEHIKHKDLEYKRQRSFLSNLKTKTGPGPGDYNHSKTSTAKRPTGGLIQPLPTNRNNRNNRNNSSTTTNNRNLRHQPIPGESVDYNAVARAQNVIRTKPIGLAGFKHPKDPVVEAAAEYLAAAQDTQSNGRRSVSGPSSLSLLSRACTIDPKSRQRGASIRVGNVVLKSVQDGLIVQASDRRGGASSSSCAIVLGGNGRTHTVSTGSTTAVSKYKKRRRAMHRVYGKAL
jgi:hypothetical protein